MARVAAALIALTAWIALAVQAEASIAQTGSPAAAIWAMLRYFTVLTNLLVAVVMTAVAIGRSVPPAVTACTTLAIVMVGVIYFLLLRGLLELSGGAVLADILLHKVTPVLVLLWWLAFAEKGRLSRRDPFLWALYPLAYLVYALVRGNAEGKYAYPFLDLGALGSTQVAINSALIALGFLIAGQAMVALDSKLARPAFSRSHG